MPSARPPVPKAHAAPSNIFPPSAQEADELLRALAQEASIKAITDARLALSGWTDAILELLAEVERGPTSEDPLDEVWHWLAASERLARSLSFAEHFSVAGVASRLENEEGKELERWQNALRQLRLAQKESSWNARYLRVIEEPLARLGKERAEQLPKLLATLLRSLRRIHSSSQLREHRMAGLLQKVLKALVSRAADELPAVFQVAAAPHRADEAIHFRDTFQCFRENYFVTEDAAGAAAEKPAVLGSAGTPRRPASGDRVQRQHSGLGWWRATVRHSQELAENSARLCGRLAGVLTDVASLRAALPQLRMDPSLMRDVQGFLELHSGPRSGLSSAELLDLKRCHEAEAQLSEVQERLQQLTRRCEKAGVDMCLDPDDCDVVPSTAEVLTLEPSADNGPLPVTVPAMQESINSLKEDLNQMGSQLENFSQLMEKVSFAPPSRSEDSDVAAQEVARRSSWFHTPPAVVPKDVPIIKVQHSISQRVISRCPSRPRTAQPAMVVMAQAVRPHTANVQVSVGSERGERSPNCADGLKDIESPEVVEDASSASPKSEVGDVEDETEEVTSNTLQCSWKVS